MAEKVLLPLQHLIASDIDLKDLSGKMLEVTVMSGNNPQEDGEPGIPHFLLFAFSQIIQKDLRRRRKIWDQKLKEMEKHKESLDKEFAKLSGNLRRMKTEQLHLKKELSAR